MYTKTITILRNNLSKPYILIFAALAAILITAPNISTKGLAADDYLHRQELFQGGSVTQLNRAITNLFIFKTPEQVSLDKNLGTEPWWTNDELKVAFFRPITTFTHWLDFTLWPDSPALMHAQSIFWYVLCCLLACLLYRKIFTDISISWAAGVATFIFIFDASHIEVVSWIANRSALIAFLIGMLALFAHIQWRDSNDQRSAYTAFALFALALFTAESGISTLGYLLAYALCMEQNSWKSRLYSIAPYLLIVLAWRALYSYLGYGASGTDLYTDPGTNPLHFLQTIIANFPILLLGQFSWIQPAAIEFLSQELRLHHWLMAVSVIVFLAYIFYPLLKEQKVARFWAAGMVLSLLPVCAAFAHHRLLIFSSLGAIGLVSLFICSLADRADWTRQKKLYWTIPAWVSFTLMLGLNFFYAPYRAYLTTNSHSAFQQSIEIFSNIDRDPAIKDQEAIVVNAPFTLAFVYFYSIRQQQQIPTPKHLRMLSHGFFDVEVHRVNENTILVRPENGYTITPGKAYNNKPMPDKDFVYFFQKLSLYHRSPRLQSSVGDKTILSGMEAEVTEVNEMGHIQEARITFTEPLESKALRWLQWNWANFSYQPFSIPAIGESTVVKGRY